MLTYAKLHAPSGHVTGVRTSPAPLATSATLVECNPDLDVIDRWYSDGLFLARVPFGLVDVLPPVALVRAEILTGLPASAWVRVNGLPVQASAAGVLMTTLLEGENLFELMGQHVGAATVRGVTLAAYRAEAWGRLKRRRNETQYGGCTLANGLRIDTDLESLTKLNGAANAAQVALAQQVAFSLDWTMADNSTVTVDAAALIQTGLTVMAHVAAVHAYARELRTELDAATTLPAIDAVQWNYGGGDG